ncbi:MULTISPECIES: ABC transporter substrate-binding protein [Streptomyces]|uniref:ABC-type branched-subunit amino acid transport system substrate-binding protein n=1 Tax=Streptomyces clavifer TaxID=68188 RepID=A0ABS4V272_9ACTN|nr:MULTISPECIES: ABC transporter substrate-binding protein [Streptomyces]KQX86098.1 ABC transporter [Streptomyces sp. Root1319]KQZ17177.1 ABC transporter [Streptomyces sp. Root55]MBP2358012.1 ABC-type branched-subunit amino acid transport system substrate-binding protein [Streptomyces clavifer]MDX2742321.1 ABC transporter substrate-binding protein [Streptomyces sp. NRRL_B-2557]MDX3063811.1 ABC transporter substrate-binding protein [Streptomyces sp. ND04-05B]
MRMRVYGAVLAALTLTLVGCSGKADTGGGAETDKTGVKTGEGVTDSKITLGALTDMTGVYASLGKSVTQAQQLWVKETNAAGGICDRQIELTVRDHGYDPQKAIAAYTELEPDVLGFAQFIGSPFVAAVEQRVDGQDKGIVLPQAWSANLLGSEYVRVIGATYDVETINLIDYLLAEKRITEGDKIGHVYFEGDYGENALAGSQHAAKEAGLTIVEQKIKPTDNDMTAQVSALKQAGVKAIVISAGPRQAASLVGVAAATGFNVPVVGNNSAYAPQLLATQAGKALQKDYYIGSSTLPIGDAAEGPAKLAKAYAAQYPKDGLDNGVIAGYNAASVFGEALKKACESKDLTREGVGKALLTIKGFGADFGISHDFTDPAAPSTRETVIMKPDAKTPGGLKVVRPAEVAPAAESFASKS